MKYLPYGAIGGAIWSAFANFLPGGVPQISVAMIPVVMLAIWAAGREPK